MSDQKLKKLQAMWDGIKHRENWDSHWRDVANYIFPEKNDVFEKYTKTKGWRKHDRLYDGSAQHYNELMSSALVSMLLNPTTTWLGLSSGDRDIDSKSAVRNYLQDVVRIILDTFSNSNFYPEIHQGFMDIGCFGTLALKVMEDKEEDIRFLAQPIYHYYIKENERGEVDTFFTLTKMSLRQVAQRYGDDFLSDPRMMSLAKNMDEKVDVICAVMPRADAKRGSLNPKRKPFASYHWIESPAIMLREAGFNEIPTIFARWNKISGEDYGRSPGMKALPDIKMLNMMQKDTIRAAQKATDPPLWLPDDGITGPVSTRPNGLNYYRAGSADKIFPMPTGANPGVGLEMIQDVRERIKQAFFIDQLQLREADRMTATEVVQRTDESLRLFGPVLTRLHNELLKPLIGRTMGILQRKNRLPTNIPEELKGRTPQVFFTSQIAKAQRIAELQNFSRLFEFIAPVAQFDPSVLDNIEGDEAFKFAVQMLGLPQEVVRDEDDVEETRQARAEAEQENSQQQQDLAQAEIINKTAGAFGS